MTHYWVYMLLLDRPNRVIDWLKISQGGMAGTVVDAKLIFATALKARVNAITIVHNHPSGNLTSSETDEALTRNL